MIAIVNMGPHDPKSPMGWRTYEVRINTEVIVRFQHKRSDGLGKCLLEASKAIERQKWGDAAVILSGSAQATESADEKGPTND